MTNSPAIAYVMQRILDAPDRDALKAVVDSFSDQTRANEHVMQLARAQWKELGK